MYIAICDDQEQECGALQHLLYAWQRERQHPVRVRVFRSPVELLAREEFMRIHRSYIVNMLQVAAFAPTEVRTFSGKSLPVSRLLYPQLQKDYLALLFHGRKE